MIYISTSTVILYAFLSQSQIFGAVIYQETVDPQIFGFQETIGPQIFGSQETIVPQLVGIQETVDLTPIAATCSAETAARVFSAILFIDLISVHDPDIVFGFSLPSDIASELYYKEKLRVFTEKGFDNAEELASISASAILLVDKFTIAAFYFVAPRALGDFLVEKGILNCENSIQIANQYMVNEEREFKSLDSKTFKSYLRALLLGVDDLLGDLGYTAEENKDNWKILTDYFYTEYSKYADFVHARS